MTHILFGTLQPVSTTFFRWLIDTGKESAGMQVIADLQGGDSNNPVALAEFEEIKDKVMEDVSRQYILI